MSKVPGQNQCLSQSAHGHDAEVGHIEMQTLVARSKVERAHELRVGWCRQQMNALKERTPERFRRPCVSPPTEQEVDLGVYGPWNDDPASESRKQLDGKAVPPTLASIEGGDERPRIAEDQPRARRKTSLIFRDRS